MICYWIDDRTSFTEGKRLTPMWIFNSKNEISVGMCWVMDHLSSDACCDFKMVTATSAVSEKWNHGWSISKVEPEYECFPLVQRTSWHIQQGDRHAEGMFRGQVCLSCIWSLQTMWRLYTYSLALCTSLSSFSNMGVKNIKSNDRTGPRCLMNCKQDLIGLIYWATTFSWKKLSLESSCRWKTFFQSPYRPIASEKANDTTHCLFYYVTFRALDVDINLGRSPLLCFWLQAFLFCRFRLLLKR